MDKGEYLNNPYLSSDDTHLLDIRIENSGRTYAVMIAAKDFQEKPFSSTQYEVQIIL